MKDILLIATFLYLSSLVTSEDIVIVECNKLGDHDKWWTTEDSSFCYAMVQSFSTYKQGEEYCRDHAGHLVSIHSDKEAEVIRIVNTKAVFYKNTFWLGLQRNPEEGVKDKWSDGTYLDFSRWSETQENPLENCAVVQHNVEQKDQEGKWFRRNCEYKSTFMCKRPKNGSSDISKPKSELLSGECEEGWLRNNQLCYKVNSDPLVFKEAQSWCNDKHFANLAAITSEATQNLLSSYLGQYSSDYFWLGGYKPKRSLTYVWKNDEAFDQYSNWGQHQPVNTWDEESCVRISMKTHHSAGVWEAADCEQKLAFICQKPINSAISKPSSTLFPEKCSGHEGYFQYRNACFKIHDSVNTWEEAEGLCNAHKGHLASYEDSLESALVQELVKRQNLSDIWIGMKGIKHEHESFLWTDGTPLYYSNWGKTTKVPANTTQCVYQNNNGEWVATVNCETKRNFACKLYLKDKPSENSKAVMKQCPPMNLTDENGNLRHWLDLDSNVNFCYDFSTTVEQYSGAQFNCYLLNGTLASIHSEHEMKLLSNVVAKMKRSVGEIWLGLHRKANGGFQWLDGTPVDFLRWAEKEPNNETDSACVQSNKSFDEWTTEQCTYSYAHYVCAIEKVDILMEERTNDSRSHLTRNVFLLVFCFIALSIIFGLGYNVRKCVQRRNRSDSMGPVVNFGYLGEKNY